MVVSTSRRITVTVSFLVAAAAGVGTLARLVAQAPAPASLTGAWTLNKDLSDQPPARGERGDRGDGERGRRGGGGGGMGRGGFGGGRMGGRGGGERPNPEDMAR